MDSHEKDTPTIHFTPSTETRHLIEQASEHTDIDSFINACIQRVADSKENN